MGVEDNDKPIGRKNLSLPEPAAVSERRLQVYCETKSAVRAISTGLEKELERTGVRVTNISPGMVETPLSSESPFESDRKKLETTDIAKAVVYAVTQPDYVNVNEITVRPV